MKTQVLHPKGLETLRTRGSTGTRVESVGGESFRALAEGLAVDAAGNVAVVGEFGSPTMAFGSLSVVNASPTFATTDVFVARLSAAGQWTQAVRAGGQGTENGTGLAFDGSGNLVVGGNYQGSLTLGTLTVRAASANQMEVFVGRLSPAGTWTQAVRAGTSGYSSAELTQLLVEPNGTVAVAGTFMSPTITFGSAVLTNSSTAFSTDVFVARLSPAGQWTQAASTGSVNYDRASALAADATGGLVLAGEFTGGPLRAGGFTLPFGSNATTTTTDVYVARLGATGAWTGVLGAGGFDDDYARALAQLPNGSMQLVGFGGAPTMSFGSIVLATAPFSAVVARIGGAGLATAVPRAVVATAVPNPAHGAVRLSWPGAPAAVVVLLDGLGREVRRQAVPAPATTATLDLNGLAPGLYVVRCGAASARLVVE